MPARTTPLSIFSFIWLCIVQTILYVIIEAVLSYSQLKLFSIPTSLTVPWSASYPLLLRAPLAELARGCAIAPATEQLERYTNDGKKTMADVIEDLKRKVKEALDAGGVDIPFPTTTIVQAS